MTIYDNSSKTEGLRHWAADRVFQVHMRDGRRDELYVTRSNLSKMTTLLSRLLGLPSVLKDGVALATRGIGATEMASAIQSSGGLNRYIGISLRDGRVDCVGRQADRTPIWVEWRPFLFEFVADYFPDAEYHVSGAEIACDVGDIRLRRWNTSLDQFATMARFGRR